MANHIVSSSDGSTTQREATIPTDPAARLAMLGDGPWLAEPDRLEWRTDGYACMIIRNPRMGNLCGYVAMPPGHPLYGVHYDTAHELVEGLTTHGGLTYSDACAGHICHVPAPGEPDDVWWLGFDCAHSGDLVPGTQQALREAYERTKSEGHRKLYADLIANDERMAGRFGRDVYRSLPYVARMTELLALQVAAHWARVQGDKTATPPEAFEAVSAILHGISSLGPAHACVLERMETTADLVREAVEAIAARGAVATVTE